MKKIQYLWVTLLGLFLSVASAQAQLVTVSGTNTIVWDTSPVVTPMIDAILAAVAGVTTVFVIVVGIRFIFKMVRRAA